MPSIQKIRARQILDSRGNPTVEVDVTLADGSFGRTLMQLARIDVLILDDWAMTPLDQAARHDLLEVIDDRTRKSTVITSQLPIEHWHA